MLEVSLCSFFYFILKESQNESGKIRRGIYMVFEGFPWFYKYFIFSIKKPLGGVKGRQEKVRLCSRLLWSKSSPAPLISVQPLWICGTAQPGLLGHVCSLQTPEVPGLSLCCSAWAGEAVRHPRPGQVWGTERGNSQEGWWAAWSQE